MNFLDFIESEEMREYIKKHDYDFTASDAMYVVCQSKKHSLKEKHAAWQKIIDTMPDEKFENKVNKDVRNVHQSLSAYMELQKRLLDKFFANEEDVIFSSGSGIIVDYEKSALIIDDPFYWCNVYTDFDLCVTDSLCSRKAPFEIRKHYIKREPYDKDYQSIWVAFSPEEEVLDVNSVFILNDEESQLYESVWRANPKLPLLIKKYECLGDHNKKSIEPSV